MDAVERAMAKETASTTQISVRVSDDWLPQLDEIAERVSRPGLELKRADALRMVLARGMEEFQKELGIKRGKR